MRETHFFLTKEEFKELKTLLKKKRGEKVIGAREGLDGGSMYVVDDKVRAWLFPKMVKKALQQRQTNPQFGVLLLLEMYELQVFFFPSPSLF